MITVDAALSRTIETFPFKNYISLQGMTRGAHANIARTVLKYLTPGARILDFGCGPCDKTAILEYLGFHCTGCDDLQEDWHQITDSRQKILDFAASCGIDFRQINGVPPAFEKGSFDMIMLHDVLEHLHDSPRDLLNNLLELATPEGLFFATMPNAGNIRKRIALLVGKTNLPPFEDFYWRPGPWRGHIREYVKSDLVNLCDYLNLEIVELRACDHMIQKVPTHIRLAYLLITRIFPGWKDSWALVARKPSGWQTKRTLPQDELMAVLKKYTPHIADGETEGSNFGPAGAIDRQVSERRGRR